MADAAMIERARAWVEAHPEHDPSDDIGDVGGWHALAAFAEAEVAAERERAERAEAAAGAMREALDLVLVAEDSRAMGEPQPGPRNRRRAAVKACRAAIFSTAAGAAALACMEAVRRYAAEGYMGERFVSAMHAAVAALKTTEEAK